MPRNAAGVYTLPETPVVTLTTIESVPENSTRNDIAAEITSSLDRAGRGGMTGPFRAADGTLALPGIAFGLDTNTGIWRSGADAFSLVAGGVALLNMTPAGIGLPDTDASHSLRLVLGSNLTADRIFTLITGDAARTLDLSAGSVVISAFTASLLDDIDAPAARATLGVDASGIPQNSKSANYTTVLADANKHLLHPTADNNPRTFTIDSNANVAYPIGTCITFVNEINVLTIAITADTLNLGGTASVGNRTLAAMGIATAMKKTATSWIINGVGLT
jgi:hypothetical protein